jgi:hypothetical protein
VRTLRKRQQIKQVRYGLGAITASNQRRTSVDLDVQGTKKFVTGLMVVDPAEGTAPKRSRQKRNNESVGILCPATTAGAQ